MTSPNKANQELLYSDKMPQKEMTRSHYLMSKITGRMAPDGRPEIDEENHGTAYMYLKEMSMQEPILMQDSEVIEEGENEESFERVSVDEPKPEIESEPNQVSELTPTPWTKIDQVITLLQNQPDDTGQFFYLTPGSENDPYDLKPNIESSEKIDRKKFYTLSKKGITTYINDEPIEYISLNDWIHDREHYRKIRKKNFFSMFRRWKIIRMWRRNIMSKKREGATAALSEKLFLLDPELGPVL